ncbi:TPA: rod shape-determining protein RodA [Candidatus Falkowbacteria bacterium]|nr:MAG: Rod shape-determining protein rodA [Candidatus Falkowbacteria bacterium GW2011_GWF2_43_32]HBA36908.1 rod shape-determining protein RodA [Candidatus Falkowbacteria bacterium]
MFNRFKIYLKNFDWIIFAAVLLLVTFGLVEIYSVALGRGNLEPLNFQKQIIFAGTGFLLLFAFAFIDSYFLKSLSRYWYGLALLVLAAVLIFGSTIRGTKGWFSLSGFSLQPVEFVKIILILFLADYFSRLAVKVKTARHFLISGLFTLILIALVLLQPDFGSALILGAIWLMMSLAAGFKRKYFVMVAAVALILLIVAWFFLFKTYQKERIINFLQPQTNSLESGYHVSQAMIAVGSGGLTGKGVGFGSQSQLKFLPEAQNDFIFAVIAEELGFLGVILILGFYSIFFTRCFLVLRKINNDFGIYFLIGAGGLIFIQIFINIGMNLGIMPIVGLSLPYVSYGGSSLISLLVLTGIMENIIIKSKISY